MKTLYLECGMGAAGDMLMAALLELHPDPGAFLSRLNSAGIPGVRVTASPCVKLGILGARVTVAVNGVEEGHGHHGGEDHHGEHHHSDMHGIEGVIENLRMSEKAKRDILSVYRLIADAESAVHGVPVDKVHFHEVGALDAVADITGVCMLIDELGPMSILASPVHAGSGYVECAHGLLPVPAPATARILKGVPVYGGDVKGELCTPTGAALLKHFVSEYGPMPVMTVDGAGYGMGTKDFSRANCIRAFLGETESGGRGEVAELSCNLDDMTPEAVAFAAELLLDSGALDVYTTPVIMKKGRAGVMLTCLCEIGSAPKMAALMFRHTSTLGIRENISRRYTLGRSVEEVQTPYGTVRVKTSAGYGVTKSKPEYEDVAKIARENDMTFDEVIK